MTTIKTSDAVTISYEDYNTIVDEVRRQKQTSWELRMEINEMKKSITPLDQNTNDWIWAPDWFWSCDGIGEPVDNTNPLVIMKRERDAFLEALIKIATLNPLIVDHIDHYPEYVRTVRKMAWAGATNLKEKKP